MENEGLDLSLCFVPQWSPFQPPLSLPSLAAWVRREGYSCNIFDENVAFYDFLLSEQAVSLLAKSIQNPRSNSASFRAAVEALSCWQEFRADVRELLKWQGADHVNVASERDIFLRDHYRAIKSLETYLRFFSTVAGDFTISPYEFNLNKHRLTRSDIDAFLASPSPVLSAFAKAAASRATTSLPRIVGLSCIGQEQLPFTLLIGKEIKASSGALVVVGGTVFSRLAERGAIPLEWFGQYFDVIVRNEGEKPLVDLLTITDWSPDSLRWIAGVVYANEGEVHSTKPPIPLRPHEIPIPDFDGLPLAQYLTGRITLPVLSSRGCYWGKCEFCHHGMVYGEKYEAYNEFNVEAAIKHLSARYGTSYFAFNDEAIPPKIFRRLGENWIKGANCYFTGLIKFEKYFQESDFRKAFDIGFRTLYVGLESASERVLNLMRKNTSQGVMVKNLQDAHRAGIWVHCFLFFGFPGEQHSDAVETIAFIKANASVIGSYGAGTFSLEHNAPIMSRLSSHGVKIVPLAPDEIDIYYDYEVADGLNRNEALQYVETLSKAVADVRKFRVSGWIPREHLLVLRSFFSEEELLDRCSELAELGDVGVFSDVRSEWSKTRVQADGAFRVINRLNSAVIDVKGASAEIIEHGLIGGVSARDVCLILPWVARGLGSGKTTNAGGDSSSFEHNPGKGDLAQSFA